MNTTKDNQAALRRESGLAFAAKPLGALEF